MNYSEDYGSDDEDGYKIEGCPMPIQPEPIIEEISVLGVSETEKESKFDADFLLDKKSSSKKSKGFSVLKEIKPSRLKSKIKNKCNEINIAIDTEFTSKFPISLQVKVKGIIADKNFDFSYLVLDESFRGFLSDQDLNNFINLHKIKFFFHDLKNNKKENILIYYLTQILYEDYQLDISDYNNKIYLWFYYCSKDLSIAFGPETTRKFYLEISQIL